MGIAAVSCYGVALVAAMVYLAMQGHPWFAFAALCLLPTTSDFEAARGLSPSIGERTSVEKGRNQ